jgi:RNA polymerase sigma-70 factor (ECF subfamily)
MRPTEGSLLKQDKHNAKAGEKAVKALKNIAKTPQEEPDYALLHRVYHHHDQRAYAALVERYLNPLWRLANSALRDSTEAEDVIQEVFAQLWDKKLDWDEKGDAQFTTWLYRVTINKCIDFKRKKANRPLDSQAIPAQYEDQKPDSEAMLGQKQKARTIREALEQLPDTQRRAMYLFYYKEHSLERIAEKMETSINAVKSLLKRGRQGVKLILSD